MPDHWSTDDEERGPPPNDSPAPDYPPELDRRAPRGLLHWHPQPLPPPTVDADLATWPAWRRVVEALHYTLLRLEHALSPNGALRAWLALCLTLFISFAVRLALAIPLVTVALTALDGWARLLREILVNLLIALLALVAFVVVSLVLGAILSVRQRQPRQPR